MDISNEMESVVDKLGVEFMSWTTGALYSLEKHASTVGSELMDFLGNLSGDVSKRAGDFFSESVDSLSKTAKGTIASWIGCKTPGVVFPQH